MSGSVCMYIYSAAELSVIKHKHSDEGSCVIKTVLCVNKRAFWGGFGDTGAVCAFMWEVFETICVYLINAVMVRLVCNHPIYCEGRGTAHRWETEMGHRKMS